MDHETSVKTNMARTTGWAPRGPRLVDHTPFGHWRIQTFIGALRHDRLDAPRVIDGAMNGEMSDRHVATQRVPTLCAGDVVIPDNLSSHRNPGAAQTLRETVLRSIPNSRAASRLLIPSTWYAWRTRL